MARKRTWKTDPRARDHSSLMTNALGHRVVVKNTRSLKAERGVVGTNSIAAWDDSELYRHASDPFEVSLVAGVRHEGGQISPQRAVRVINKSVDKYIASVYQVYNTRTDELARKPKWYDHAEEMKHLDEAREAFSNVSTWVGLFATNLYDTLDTIRCAEIANERYLRKGCVDAVVDGLNLGIDDLFSENFINGFVKSYSLMQFKNAQCHSILTNELLRNKPIVWKKLDSLDITKRIDDMRGIEHWRLTNDQIDLVTEYAKGKRDDLENAIQGGSKDCIVESVKCAIDLLKIIAKVELDESGTGTGTGTGAGTGEVVSDELDKDKDKPATPDQNDGNHDSWQKRTDFTNAVDSVYNEALDIDREINDLMKEQSEFTKSFIGGSSTLKDRTAKGEQDIELSDDTGEYLEEHKVHVVTYPTENIILNANTINLLQDIERNGTLRKYRTGEPTPDMWKMKQLGDTRVFGKTPKKSGQLLVMVDCSGSMGSGYHEGESGYLAYQTAAAIAEAFPMAQVFGFNSSDYKCYIYPLPSGTMLGDQATSLGYSLGGNSDCVALLYMEQLLSGEMSDSLGVIISDGAPAPPSPLHYSHLASHNKACAHRLHANGLRFVSVLVGGYEDDEYYPSDCKVFLNEVSEMHKVGEAIQRIGQTFN